MVSKEVLVVNESGLESKVAAKFIQKASTYKSKIWIEREHKKANAKSLLGLLSLGIAQGSKILIIAEGSDEKKAVKELESYISQGIIEN